MSDDPTPLHLRLRAHIERGSELGRLNLEQLPTELKADILSAAEDLEEYDFSFNLRWQADMRAIKRWQEANPGNDLVWPDHADLVVWLLGELERAGGPKD